MSSPVTSGRAPGKRDTFSSRRIFILAAIGSAVGLGNIWRFPYVAYEGGGGAFMIPYVVALLCAGIPILFFDYALGHRSRAGAPLAFRRVDRKAEWIGWWTVGICVVIGIYYAAILAWAGSYVYFSLTKAWGSDPEAFFMNDFLHISEDVSVHVDVVPSVLWPLVAVWAVVTLIMAMGVQRGIGLLSAIGIPVLLLTFGTLVVQALLLPGAAMGLNAFFTPDWSALLEGKVWMSAIGQIFFSLSVGFGIMITYSSYVRRDNDMTGSGLVVGFANSSFELLAGIGVFSALGFMATAAAVPVDEVVSSGIGLAFIAFPTIISQAPGGTVIGVLFFISLVIAGATSMVSILEVIVSALRDKLELGRVSASLIVCLPMALFSCLFLGSSSGLYVLDTLDAFVNSFGILAAALIAIVVVVWLARKLSNLRNHLNDHGTFKLGHFWTALVAVVIPVALLVLLVQDFLTQLAEPYGGYPQEFVNIFGWGMVVFLIVGGVILSLIPWRGHIHLDGAPPPEDDDDFGDGPATPYGPAAGGPVPERGNR